MRSIGIVLVFLLLSELSSGQIVKQRDTIRSFKDINLFILRFYQARADSARNNCWKGCVFVRFNFDKTEKPINVEINDGTPPFIKEALLDLFKNLKEQVIDIRALKTLSSRTFLQPVIVVNNDGCGFLDSFQPEKRDAKIEKVYVDRQINSDQYISSFLDMLSFSGKETDFLDCVVLPPAYPPIPMF